MGPLISQLFAVFLPIVRDLIKKYQAAHNGALPTDEEVTAQFEADVAKYLAEGAAWTAAHPNA